MVQVDNTCHGDRIAFPDTPRVRTPGVESEGSCGTLFLRVTALNRAGGTRPIDSSSRRWMNRSSCGLPASDPRPAGLISTMQRGAADPPRAYAVARFRTQ